MDAWSIFVTLQRFKMKFKLNFNSHHNGIA